MVYIFSLLIFFPGAAGSVVSRKPVYPICVVVPITKKKYQRTKTRSGADLEPQIGTINKWAEPTTGPTTAKAHPQ